MIRVLVVDDHASFRQPLSFFLGREPDIDIVGEAGTLAEAKPLLSNVDVPIIDIDLPDGSGIDLIKELRRANPNGTALVLTGSTDRGEIAWAVQAGASAVLHKSAGVHEVIDAVRRLSNGECLLAAEEIVEMFRLAGQQRDRDFRARMTVGRLTPREREVLQALANGLSDKQIGLRLYISSETVRTHMVNILGKLGVDTRLQALVFALRHGAVTIT